MSDFWKQLILNVHLCFAVLFFGVSPEYLNFSECACSWKMIDIYGTPWLLSNEECLGKSLHYYNTKSWLNILHWKQNLKHCHWRAWVTPTGSGCFSDTQLNACLYVVTCYKSKGVWISLTIDEGVDLYYLAFTAGSFHTHTNCSYVSWSMVSHSCV